MGFLESVKSWFRSEAAEARQVGRSTKTRLERDLERREAELAATPEQRLEQLQGKIADGDATFEDIQGKIDGRGALADATTDVADIDRPAKDDVLDLDSEEIDPPDPT